MKRGNEAPASPKQIESSTVDGSGRKGGGGEGSGGTIPLARAFIIAAGHTSNRPSPPPPGMAPPPPPPPCKKLKKVVAVRAIMGVPDRRGGVARSRSYVRLVELWMTRQAPLLSFAVRDGLFCGLGFN